MAFFVSKLMSSTPLKLIRSTRNFYLGWSQKEKVVPSQRMTPWRLRTSWSRTTTGPLKKSCLSLKTQFSHMVMKRWSWRRLTSDRGREQSRAWLTIHYFCLLDHGELPGGMEVDVAFLYNIWNKNKQQVWQDKLK